MVAADQVGPPPEIAPIEAMGLAGQNPNGTGFAEYTMTNGIEGSWTPIPTQWDNSYLENLFKFEWSRRKVRPARCNGPRPTRMRRRPLTPISRAK